MSGTLTDLREALAQDRPQTQAPTNGRSTAPDDRPRLDVPAWLEARGQRFRTKREEAKSRTLYHLETCPVHTDPDGHRFECCVIQEDSGKLAAHCKHSDSYGWRDFKEAISKPDSEHWIGERPEARSRRKRFRGEKAEAKEKQVNVTQTSFKALPDGTLLEMCYNQERSPSKFFARRNPATGEVDYPASVPLEDQGEMIAPYEDRMPDEGVILLPSEATPYESVAVLLNEVQAFIHRYVGLSSVYEQLAAYYVLLTWVYDSFNVLPYLRALGDWGTGKSRFLTVVGNLCYKAIFASGATTPSPIFRMLQKYAGTLILDEADWRYSDANVEIVKILNCGYATGFPVLRSEGESNEPKAFRVFGPKIIATREEWQDRALESRCLTENMDGKFRPDVPYILPHSFTEEALRLRNQLLTFRFRHYGPREVDLSLADSSIEPRLNQVMLPLASVIEDGKVRETFKTFIRAYNDRLLADRGLSL